MKDRKIEAMHRLFGTTPGKICRGCPHLERRGSAHRTLFKCTVYGISSSEATDWTASWAACGLFNNMDVGEHRGVYKRLGRSIESAPIPGQISMFPKD